MKSKCLCLIVLLLLTFVIPVCAGDINSLSATDTLNIIKLNKQAYNNRLTDPENTVQQARRIVVLAHRLKYPNGEAEANRVIGVGFGYMSQPDTAFSYYLKAIALFKTVNNLDGQGKVSNNIGNLYHESDYEKAFEYYKSALNIAEQVKDEDLIATANLNIGVIHYRKKQYRQALDCYNKSNEIFVKLQNTTNMMFCMQNIGVVYYNLGELDLAEKLLLEANKQAKAKDLNAAVASINLTLTLLFERKGLFEEAEKYLAEGLNYANLVKSAKLVNDYKKTKYEVEFAHKDYKAALFSLRDIYRSDSVTYQSSESIRLNLQRIQFQQIENQHHNDIIVAEQKKQQILFWSTILVAGLLLVVVFLLISNVNRKAKTNKHLTELNLKITEQKENLNQINHHLEEIIDERTKDLQVKNKKLADYSLHLSHQIRGPIATLKGLLNLEKDKLIEQDECIKLMNKCVSEIDDNIIDMSGMLHDSTPKNN